MSLAVIGVRTLHWRSCVAPGSCVLSWDLALEAQDSVVAFRLWLESAGSSHARKPFNMLLTSPGVRGRFIQLTVSPRQGAGIRAPCTSPDVARPQALRFAIQAWSHGTSVTPPLAMTIGKSSAFCWADLVWLVIPRCHFKETRTPWHIMQNLMDEVQVRDTASSIHSQQQIWSHASVHQRVTDTISNGMQRLDLHDSQWSRLTGWCLCGQLQFVPVQRSFLSLHTSKHCRNPWHSVQI